MTAIPDTTTDTTTDTAAHRRPHIVVGVDGSDSSRQALGWAVQLGTAVGADVLAIAAWTYPTSYGWSAVPTDWDPAQDALTMLTGVIDDLVGPDIPRHVRYQVSEGSAAGVLIAAAQHALMLVVGSRGRGGFTGLLLGSVSATVAEHAPCPVLVTHGETPVAAGPSVLARTRRQA